MKAAVLTLGCKVNDVESGSITRGLEDLGFQVLHREDPADLYIINTCAVTAEAERKSRQAIARVLRLNPNATVIVCGCASEKSPEDFKKKENVKFVFGAKQKRGVLSVAEKLIKDTNFCFDGNECEISLEKGNIPYEELPMPEFIKTRNFVKIQDGCNRFCSYCIIPYLRGRSRSRTIESATSEILKSTAMETVITGIDISDYHDGDKDLSDLLNSIKDAKTRIRLGSIEESLITPKFLNAAANVKNFAPQFHLSLQSGSNSVLKSMNRKYTREDFLEKCRLIYSVFPSASLTTDIIVGFPTETEEDFEQSLSIVEEAEFLHVHAFPYSPREGTNAYKRYKELPAAVKKERLLRLIEKGEEVKKKYLNKYIGKNLYMIPETFSDNYMDGYSENYIRLYVEGEMEKVPTTVKAVEIYKDGMKAIIIEN